MSTKAIMEKLRRERVPLAKPDPRLGEALAAAFLDAFLPGLPDDLRGAWLGRVERGKTLVPELSALTGTNLVSWLRDSRERLYEDCTRFLLALRESDQSRARWLAGTLPFRFALHAAATNEFLTRLGKSRTNCLFYRYCLCRKPEGLEAAAYLEGLCAIVLKTIRYVHPEDIQEGTWTRERTKSFFIQIILEEAARYRTSTAEEIAAYALDFKFAQTKVLCQSRLLDVIRKVQRRGQNRFDLSLDAPTGKEDERLWETIAAPVAHREVSRVELLTFVSRGKLRDEVGQLGLDFVRACVNLYPNNLGKGNITKELGRIREVGPRQAREQKERAKKEIREALEKGRPAIKALRELLPTD